ncbi:MAG TPA: hypothetical protein VMU88_03010, partial [bacterium]|nr:hypothetical protein [bacterium]
MMGLFAPLGSQAAVSISNIQISNSNPTPGSVVAVTITYCETANVTPYWLVAVNPSSNTIQACPAANQYFLVDSNTTPTGVSVVSGTQDDSTATGNGWAGVPVPNTPPACPYTQIFNVTIPSTLSAGAYNLDVSAGDYYVQCNSGSVAHTSTVINIPYPPANVSLVKIADGTSPNDGNLVLFRIDYTYGNTGPVTITDNIPANVSLVSPTASAISPGGSLAGSTITWVLPASLPTVTGEVWFLTQVNGGVAAGTAITNQASATSAATGSVTSNTAQANVGEAGFTLTKSEMPINATLNPGDVVTYALAYQISGLNLDLYDSYDNDTNGTTNAGTKGYDGTGYNYNTTGGTGTFTTQSDAQGNHYINAFTGGGQNSNYPALLRQSPNISLCSGDFMVEGDMEIPPGYDSGGDATMVVAFDPGTQEGYMLGMSLDSGPGNFFVQENNGPGNVSFPGTATNATIGTSITAGVWYTAEALVTGTGPITIQAKIWPRGTT